MIVRRGSAVEHNRRGDDGMQPWIGQPVGECDAGERHHGRDECGDGEYDGDDKTLDVIPVRFVDCPAWVFDVVFGGIFD